MNPTMSSTAAGSRITVYFPAGISCGCAESTAFCAAVSASASGSRFPTSGEFAFCHPDESLASMVIETSARRLRVPAAQPPRIEDSFQRFRTGKNSGGRELVPVRHADNLS